MLKSTIDAEGNRVVVEMSAAELEEIRALGVVSTIPTSVTMRQARLALLAAGKLSQVDTAISSIPDNMQRAAAAIEWEYAQTVDRASPFTATLAAALGLSETDLDNLFTAAGAL